MKKEPKLINLGLNPVIIVGEKMGAQRPGEDTFALEGNRTGDFVHEAIEGLDNIILTNVVNHYYPGNFDRNKFVGEGVLDLIELIDSYAPRKIITLGNIAAEYVKSIKYQGPVIELRHPSWINRFKSKLRFEYIKILRDAVIG